VVNTAWPVLAHTISAAHSLVYSVETLKSGEAQLVVGGGVACNLRWGQQAESCGQHRKAWYCTRHGDAGKQSCGVGVHVQVKGESVCGTG
jgi:hypothetical protein